MKKLVALFVFLLIFNPIANAQDISYIASNGENIYALSGNYIWQIMHNGKDWKRITIDGFSNDKSNRLERITSSGSRIYATSSMGEMLRSDDNCVTWNKSIPVIDGPYYDAETIIVNGNTIYIGNDRSYDKTCGMHVSEDGGKNWKTDKIYNKCKINAIIVKDDIIYAGGSKDYKPFLQMSADNGTTWRPLDKHFKGNGEVNSMAIKETGIIVCLTSGGMHKINDGTCTKISEISSYHMALAGNTIFLSVYNEGVRISSDEGKTWTSANNGLEPKEGKLVVSQLLVCGSAIYALEKKNLYVSLDQGANWKRCKQENDIKELIAFSDTNSQALQKKKEEENLARQQAAEDLAAEQKIKEEEEKKVVEAARDLYHHGLSEFCNGRFNDALAFLNQSIKLYPKNTLAITIRGYCYLKNKEYEKAINDFLVAFDTDKNFNLSYLTCAYSLSGKGNEAEKSLAVFLNSPNNDHVKLINSMKDMEKSKLTNELAISNNPKDITKKALYYILHNDYEKALNEINTAIKTSPGEYSFYKTRGYINFKLNNNADAVKDYVTALESDAANKDMIRNSYEKDSYSVWEHLKYFGKDDEALYHAGLISIERANYYNLNEKEKYMTEALDYFTKSIQLNANADEYYLARARTYEISNNLDQALADYNKAHLLNPKNPKYEMHFNKEVTWVDCPKCNGKGYFEGQYKETQSTYEKKAGGSTLGSWEAGHTSYGGDQYKLSGSTSTVKTGNIQCECSRVASSHMGKIKKKAYEPSLRIVK